MMKLILDLVCMERDVDGIFLESCDSVENYEVRVNKRRRKLNESE